MKIVRLATTEQNHPGFKVAYEGHECQWNGPSWPYATSITLKAMANLLRNYNHSAFCDFIISDLVGIRPSIDDKLTVQPLIPAEYWDWFCPDHVKYHNKILTIVWDRDSSKYQKGKGVSVYIDGELKHNSEMLEKIVKNIWTATDFRDIANVE